MSADNYYRICRHPNGGFTAVMGFMSNEEPAQPTAACLQFSTVGEAYDWADHDPVIEYGINIDRDCLDPDPETLCTVCGNDTPTVRCCGQPFDYERQDNH